MTTPLGSVHVLERDGRRVRLTRQTRETDWLRGSDAAGPGSRSATDTPAPRLTRLRPRVTPAGAATHPMSEIDRYPAALRP